MRIDGREYDRLCSQHAKIRSPKWFRQNVLSLRGATLVTRKHSAIHNVRVKWIGNHVTIFFSAHRMPFSESYLAVVATTSDAGGAALLLTAAQSIWKSVVGIDVIELGRRLVVPTAERFSTVYGDDRALIAGQQNNVRVVWIDPDVLVIVASRRTAERHPGLTAVAGLPTDRAGYINHFGIFWIEARNREIAATDSTRWSGILCGYRPVVASIIRSKEVDAGRRSDRSKKSFGRTWSNRQVRLNDSFRKSAL